MITIVILSAVLHVGFSESPLFNYKPFRPSQPYPIIDRIPSDVPPKQYGPPKPVYGAPGRPDDTVEPTTPPNNFHSNPSKFSSPAFGQIQELPQKDHRGTTIVFPSKQMSAQKFNQLSQQQLPGFNKQQQKFQMFTATNLLPGQLLPNPVQMHTFNANKATSQLIQVPQSIQQLPFKNFNYEIQKSQEFQLRDATPTRAPPSNVNFNNQNTINVQTPSLFNINTAPKQTMSRNNQKLKIQPNTRPRSKMSSDSFDTQFSNDGVLAAKRAASARRGGKATSLAPSRQYLSPESTTSKPFVSPTIRRRPSTTEATETQNIPLGRGPNVAISNSFAGRLFLLQPDGRLEPVILMRANNADDSNVGHRNIISPAELLQSIFNKVPVHIPK